MAAITVPVEKVTRVKDAHGAHCVECGVTFDVTTCPYWHWSRSAWMHEQGTGHRPVLFRIA